MVEAESFLPYGRQWIEDDDIAAVASVLRSDRLTQGPAVERFEDALREQAGARHAVAVANGTAALQLCCMAADLKPGDEGITSTLTFLASASCMAACGAKPRFSDVLASTLTMDVASASHQVNDRTKVLIPVDFAGLPCDLEQVRRLADGHGLTVIEDASHSLGARYRDQPIGGTGLADMVVFSFHPVKHITTGEGGAILTDDAVLARRLRRLRHHGVERSRDELESWHGPWYYEQHELGMNARITDIQCALGTSQLSKLDRFIARRQAIAARYDEAFGDMEGLTVQSTPPDRTNAHHLFVVHLDPKRFDRALVHERMASQGIHCQVHYVPVHLQPYYRRLCRTAAGDCPKAEAYYEGCLSLPMFPAMDDGDVERVISTLLGCLTPPVRVGPRARPTLRSSV